MVGIFVAALLRGAAAQEAMAEGVAAATASVLAHETASFRPEDRRRIKAQVHPATVAGTG